MKDIKKLNEKDRDYPYCTEKVKTAGIPQEWVREAIEWPAQVVPGYGGRKVAHRKYMIEDKEYLLRVVFEEKEGYYSVVSGYLTSQVRRYWKEEKSENRI